MDSKPAIENQKIDVRNPRVLRRNVSALMIDSGSFGMAMGFIGYSTVLPALALALTHSEPLVGLVSTVWVGLWLLPQLIAGRWMAGRPRKKPILVYAGAISRFTLALFAILLIFGKAIDRNWLFVFFLIAIAIFRGADAFAAVAWFDVISKVLPLNLRGRVLGVMQAIAFGLQFLASFVVTWALGAFGPTFPENYAILFGLAAVAILISLAMLASLLEPAAQVANNVSDQMHLTQHIRHIWRTDQAFRQLSIARILVGVNALALPFYVVHATEYLHVPSDSIGLFLAAQTIGGVLSAAILGVVNERYGSAIVVRMTQLLALIPPVLGAALHFAGLGNITLATSGYLLAFAAIGATDGSYMVGYLTYILEIAPESERTAYTGLANTIGGLLVIAPTIGGVLLQLTSFPVLFIAAGLGPLAGLFVAWTLPKAKQQE
ncbi:MAG TPA: MFS transporter [Anaerolineae bacterium]